MCVCNQGGTQFRWYYRCYCLQYVWMLYFSAFVCLVHCRIIKVDKICGECVSASVHVVKFKCAGLVDADLFSSVGKLCVFWCLPCFALLRFASQHSFGLCEKFYSTNLVRCCLFVFLCEQKWSCTSLNRCRTSKMKQKIIKKTNDKWIYGADM